jgi:hypothetical protein
MMGRRTHPLEVILLFERLKIEPKKMQEYLAERGHNYSYSTLKKYYGYWGACNAIAQSIIETKPFIRKPGE